MYSKKSPSRASLPAARTQELEGTIQSHRDGHGFFIPDDGQDDVFIAPNDMRAVLHNDRVRVRVTGQDKRGRLQGHITALIERTSRTIIGRVLCEGGLWLLAPEDPRFTQDVLLREGPGAATEGQVVVAEWLDTPALYAQPTARVVEVLGDIDDPGMEIEIAVRKYEVPHVFSEACLSQAAKLPTKVLARDRKDRVDLRDVPLVTIDGEDARDFDDAVYCEPIALGKTQGWRLIVAIADVSHYVQNGQPIDVDAYERATSVYFPRRVIPMLPEKLSNGLCSLNPGVDRLCMVCDMVITAAGELHAYQFYSAVMHSHARLTYTQVAQILEAPQAAAATQPQIAARVPDLLHLQGVFHSLRTARNARGAVDFDTVETQVICDDAGHISRIEPRVRNDAHRIIEECMLAANVCAADFIEHHERTALFRVHDAPSLDKIDILRNYLRTLGITAHVDDRPSPAQFQHIAQATHERSDAQQIHTMLLRSMMQAIYTPENTGHFGLAFDAYTHFTSPIRRYPDLLVHRVIKAILARRDYQLPALPKPGAAHARLQKQLNRKPQNAHTPDRSLGQKSTGYRPADTPRTASARAQLQAWQAAGLHCSANERRADEASRDVMAWLKCKYMRSYLGEVFTGTVSSVTSFGLFVTLDGIYVEGLVHISELGTDYFRFDEARQELRGQRSNARFTIGTPLRVQVSRVDLDARRIDFLPVPDDFQPQKTQKIRDNNAASPSSALKKSTKQSSPHPPSKIPRRMTKKTITPAKSTQKSNSTFSTKTKKKTKT